MNNLSMVLSGINDFLYTYLLIGLLPICGIFYSVKTKFAQLRFLPDSIKLISEKTSGTKISAFKAFIISIASRVGTGNIAGIAIAIVIGGPGSMVWMWIMAIIGAASGFAESVLAQMYKTLNEDGSSRGGPSYYIRKALGSRKLGILFSILLIIAFAYGFNALQTNIISTAFEYHIPNYASNIGAHVTIGVIFAALTASIIFGGVHRIGFISSIIVPIMAGIYLMIGAGVIITNIQKMPEILSLMFKNAFDFNAIFGGFAGSVVIVGIKRGLLSNEAGMGSAPNAAASADTSHPVKQGIVQTLSVFVDTIVCTTSAAIVLFSNVPLDGKYMGIPHVQQAVSSQLGVAGIYFITVSVLLFAFTSIIGNYCYAESNFLFIKNNKKLLNIFRITCIFTVMIAPVLSSSWVWDFAEVAMALMSTVNIVAILLLFKRVKICTDDYKRQKSLGIDPVFNAPKCGIFDTDVWK
ncbi:MAG: alanine:cation symporter family protein [Oscillospiraceae bacterium]|jgi:AGCS family alanine or glycine:cation symporter|nr:alanine:cation symporter family protein [Oscillospiraceae bacterium]